MPRLADQWNQTKSKAKHNRKTKTSAKHNEPTQRRVVDDGEKDETACELVDSESDSE